MDGNPPVDVAKVAIMCGGCHRPSTSRSASERRAGGAGRPPRAAGGAGRARRAEKLPGDDLKGARFPSGGLARPPVRERDAVVGCVGLPSYGLAQPIGTARELRFDLLLLSDVLFDVDKAELRPDADGMLRQLLAEVAVRMKAPPYRIEGHTDGNGADAYNLDLSRRRAESAKLWLKRSGVAGAGVGTQGCGGGRARRRRGLRQERTGGAALGA